jgi:hypothetical protein
MERRQFTAVAVTFVTEVRGVDLSGETCIAVARVSWLHVGNW